MSGYPWPPCPRCGRVPDFQGRPQCYCPQADAQRIMRELHAQTKRDAPPLAVPPLRLTSTPAPVQPSRGLPLFDQED